VTPAADQFDVIRARIAEIRDAETARCPQSASRTLHDCLRNASRCGESCPFYNDWIGPQK
jgi:hypothetical protein